MSMEKKTFSSLLLTATLLITACSGSDDITPNDPPSNNKPIEIALQSDTVYLSKGNIGKLCFNIANTPTNFNVNDLHFRQIDTVISTNFELKEITSENNGYALQIKDNGGSYHYQETVSVFYNDSTLATFVVKSQHNNEQNINNTLGKEETFTLTESFTATQAPVLGATYHLTFNAEQPWMVHATCNNEETSDIQFSAISGEPGNHTIQLTLPENTSLEAKDYKIDIVYKTEKNRSAIGNAIMNGIYYAFTTFAIAQVGYYDVLRLEHIHLGEGGTLNEVLCTEYNCTTEQLAELATELYIEGPMSGEDFKFIKEKLTAIRVLNMLNADIAEIPDFAFKDCKSLKYIVLPNKLQRIGEQAFFRSGLKNASLAMPPLLSGIGPSAFEDTNISGSIYFTGLSSTVNIGGYTFAGTHINMLFFGEGVRVINENKYGVALSLGETNIAYIYLPSTLRQINNYFFNVGDKSSNIARVDCRAYTPPTTYGHFAIDKVNCLFIPYFAYDNYKGTTYWEKFDVHKKLFPVLF